MPTIFPGAAWVPIPGSDQRARRRKGRGVGYHVAVFEGPSLAKIDAGTGNDSHLYVRYDGTVEQNVDLDLISYAMVDGNATLITVETEGGANPATVETEPWTPQQVATLARILRWAHDTEGAPMQLMPDSRPASQGACYHRQGVDPWRVSGGEKWSTVYGKVCPGAAKIAQLPQIVALAQNPDQEDPLAAISDADWAQFVAFVHEIPKRVWGTEIQGSGSSELAQPTAAERVLVDTRYAATVGRNAALSLSSDLQAALAKQGVTVTDAQLQTALREVLGSLDNPS